MQTSCSGLMSPTVHGRAQHGHWTAAKGRLRYIGGTLRHGICFGGSSTTVEGYCDADYAIDLQTRRSTTGFVYILGGGAI